MKKDDVTELIDYFAANHGIKDFQGHQAKVHSVGWNCDGNRLASGSYDETIITYLLENDRLSKDQTFRGHTASVDQLSWHPFLPNLFASASGDKSVRIWDAKISTQSIAHTVTKGENINVTWSPDGKTLAVGNKDDLVSFIDVKTHKIIAEEQFKFEVNEIAWNPAGNYFFLTTSSGGVQIMSYPQLKVVHTVQAHTAAALCIDFDKTGKYFAIGSADSITSVWSLSELLPVHTYHRLDWPIRSISFSHDGKMIASASEDHTIDISHVETGERVTKVPCDSPTFTIAWHPTKYLLAFACEDVEKHSSSRGNGVKLFGLTS